MNIGSRAFAMMACLYCVASAGAQGLTFEQAQRRLEEGNTRFWSGRAVNPRADASRRHDTAERGQRPFAAILTCADSRVAVERIFDLGIGDVLIARVAGNICGNDELATLEFGAGSLNVPLIVVLGHSQCGAVKAAVSGADVGGKIPIILSQIEPAVRAARRQNTGLKGDALLDAAVQANVMHSIAELLGGSDPLRVAVRDDKVRVVGAEYDVATGRITWLGRHPDEENLVQEHPRANATGNGGHFEPPSTPGPPKADAAPPAVDPATVTARGALALLKEGNSHFVRGAAVNPRSDAARLRETATAQHPCACLLTCSDARIAPTRLFDQGIGDLFEVRVAANVANDTEIGSLEYAVEHLHVPLLVVLGHLQCAELGDTQRATRLGEHETRLLEKFLPGSKFASSAPAEPKANETFEQHHIRATIRALREGSPLMVEQEQAGTLKIVGALYDPASGEVAWLDEPAAASEPAAP